MTKDIPKPPTTKTISFKIGGKIIDIESKAKLVEPGESPKVVIKKLKEASRKRVFPVMDI